MKQITKLELIEMMKNCEQTKGQSVLDHGISVKNYLFDLINHLRTGDKLEYDWVLPDWIYSEKDLILSSIPDDDTLELYTTYHDCGMLMVRDTFLIMLKYHIKFSNKFLITMLRLN